MSGKPQRHENSKRAMELLLVDLVQSEPALSMAEQATPRLSADQLLRHQNRMQINAEDARLWRAGHIALRIAIERWVGIGIRKATYDIEPGGRPRLLKTDSLRHAPHFSLAHAGSFALIAISRVGPIGADIEVTRDVKISGVRRQRIEQAALQAANGAALPEQSPARFLQAWVRLEAIAKASGLGIGRILTEAGVIGSGAALSQPAAPSTAVGQMVYDLAMPPGVFAAIAGIDVLPLVAVAEFPGDAQGLSSFLNA